MDANTVLHELTADVKDRINYLVYKDICRKENITVRDLEIAYEYARVNVTMVEESQTPMLELFLLDRHRHIAYGGARGGGKSWAGSSGAARAPTERN